MDCRSSPTWVTTLGTASTAPVSDTKIYQSLIASCRSHTCTRAAAVSEEIIKATADIMVDSGLKKAGYEYLVIDGNRPSCADGCMLDLYKLTQ